MERPIFLIGFMAAGKSTVGPLVAAALGWRFIDLDREIARAQGRGDAASSATVGTADVAALVARDEAAFRRDERDALRALIAAAALDPAVVIATGGGAPCHHDNMARMRGSGLVICLDVSSKIAHHRAALDSTARPLMGDLTEAQRLWKARASAYREAHAVVPTEDLAPAAVAARVVAVARSARLLPRVDTVAWVATAAPYPVVVAPAVWPLIAAHGAVEGAARGEGGDGGATSYHVVMDRAVGALHGAAFAAGLSQTASATLAAPAASATSATSARTTYWHDVAPGEASKTLASYESLVGSLLRSHVDRHAHILAVGGGATSDAAGFAAATIMRGVAWSVVPTTLLAMVDAAIGGKTALDTAHGKNTLGAFWQPRGVWAGLDVLATLPARERQSAFGELVKYALLAGSELWAQIAAQSTWARDGGPPPQGLAEVVYQAARYKCHVVSIDERETKGARILLNLGHTFGHAIEHAHGGAIAHGEAVGLGLLAAARVSAAIGWAAPSLEGEISALLGACGLQAELAPHLGARTMDYISSDKKRRGDSIAFVAIRDVGACEAVDLPLAEVVRILRSGGN